MRSIDRAGWPCHHGQRSSHLWSHSAHLWALTATAQALRLQESHPSFRQDLPHFCKIHDFTYGIIWQPIYGGGTDRDGAFIMKKGIPLPERLKVDKLRSFGGFAMASSSHHFVEGQSIPGLAFDRRDWAFVADMQA